MIQTETQAEGILHVGQPVIVRKEDGFDQGVPKRKEIARILLTTWEPEECQRLQVPRQELTLVFTDGTTAGVYDRVTPASSQER